MTIYPSKGFELVVAEGAEKLAEMELWQQLRLLSLNQIQGLNMGSS
jgi:hypothetical protein